MLSVLSLLLADLYLLYFVGDGGSRYAYVQPEVLPEGGSLLDVGIRERSWCRGSIENSSSMLGSVSDM